MPSSPGGICRSQSCNSRATANGYCEAHKDAQNDSKRNYDRFRAGDPTRALYRCKRWQNVRMVVLRRDVLCQSCGHEAATECDHILTARLVLDNFGIDEFYNKDRLQGLCHACHSVKTTHESGWCGRKGTQLTVEQLGDRTNTTVVCGQAGSGKTTYVATHAAPHDLTWCYDVTMNVITGLPMHQGLPGAIGSVLADRDRWIEATRYSSNHCWLIVSNETSAIVSMMRDAGATIVVMTTDEDECKRRLKQRFIEENT